MLACCAAFVWRCQMDGPGAGGGREASSDAGTNALLPAALLFAVAEAVRVADDEEGKGAAVADGRGGRGMLLVTAAGREAAAAAGAALVDTAAMDALAADDAAAAAAAAATVHGAAAEAEEARGKGCDTLDLCSESPFARAGRARIGGGGGALIGIPAPFCCTPFASA